MKHDAAGRRRQFAPAAHATYGDGTEIPLDHLRTVMRTSAACEVIYPWQAGDLLMLDNVLTQHGRKPYTGARRVLVAMG